MYKAAFTKVRPPDCRGQGSSRVLGFAAVGEAPATLCAFWAQRDSATIFHKHCPFYSLWGLVIGFIGVKTISRLERTTGIFHHDGRAPGIRCLELGV